MAEVLLRLAAHGHLARVVAVEVEPTQRRGLLRERGNEQEQAGEPRGHVHAVVVPARATDLRTATTATLTDRPRGAMLRAAFRLHLTPR
jgi:hypothetical protein